MAAILNNFKIVGLDMSFRETNRGHPFSTRMHVMTPFQDQDSIKFFCLRHPPFPI